MADNDLIYNLFFLIFTLGPRDFIILKFGVIVYTYKLLPMMFVATSCDCWY